MRQLSFCTIDPNVGCAYLDARPENSRILIQESDLCNHRVRRYSGPCKRSEQGRVCNRFLSHIREVDALVHVVRCFDDESVAHVDGSVDPVRDAETINFELIFADMETRQANRRTRRRQSGGKSMPTAYNL